MKSHVLLGFAFAAQALSATVNRGNGRDSVTNRPFTFPNFPGGSGKRAPEAAPEPGDIQFAEFAGNGPNPDEVQIIGVTYGGTGCPDGSVSNVLSDDRSILTLIFDEYVAEIGPGISVGQARKNCQLNINLRYPGGFQYSVFSADYRGYAYLEEGVTGTQKSTYYFSGQRDQTSTKTSWKGPMDEDFLLHDEADSTSIVWSPCGQNGALNINSQVRLTSTDRNATGQLTNDSLDASFEQVVHVRWKECKE